MTSRRFVRGFLWTVLGLLVLDALVAGGLWWYLHPAVLRTNGIVYGQRGSRSLALDAIQLVVHPGGQHGWWTMVFDLRKFADWLDQHLRPAERPGGYRPASSGSHCTASMMT